MAQKRSREERLSVVVRNSATREEVARFDPPVAPDESPSLANSVKRMRAANDRLNKALMPTDAQAARGRKGA